MTQSFEQAYKRLETILAKLSSDEVSLEDSMTFFEEANTLIKECNQLLTSAEQKIEKLIAVKDGEAITESFEPPNSHILT